jgi:small subunit ribosomal protein S18
MIKKPRRERSGPRTPRPPRVVVKKDFVFSYKDPDMLRNFVTGQGMILSRVRTGLTQKQQRQLAVEVKRARHLALLPFIQSVL